MKKQIIILALVAATFAPFQARPAHADDFGSDGFGIGPGVIYMMAYYTALMKCYIDALGTPVAVDCGPSEAP